jgi:hypothetical protein
MPTDKKISELPVASVINPTDISVLVDANTDFQYGFSTLLTFLSANLSVGAVLTFGTGAIPSNTVGNNGDVYVKTDTGQFAQKLSGVWTVVYTIVQGVVGSTIYYGSAAPLSGTGINGDTYLQTVGGIFFQKISGTWTAQFSMATGPTGPQGASGTNGTNGTNGNTVLYGNTNPSNSLGVDGNFYLNTSNYTFFGPKVSGAWPAGASIIGPAGPTTPPTKLDFAKGVPNPIIISNWQGTYAPTYGNFPSIEISTEDKTAINTLNTLVAGSGGTNGVYNNVALTGGSGTGATANITIAGGVVTICVPVLPGTNYVAGDTLSATIGSITGFSIKVATVGETFITQAWNVSKVYDATGLLLQMFVISDPAMDPSTPVTADAIRVVFR